MISRARTAPRLAPSTVLTVVCGQLCPDPPLAGTGAAEMSESRGLRPVAASFDRPGELPSSGGRALRPLQVQTRNRREGVNEEKTHHTGRLPLLMALGGAGPALAQTVAEPRCRQRRRVPRPPTAVPRPKAVPRASRPARRVRAAAAAPGEVSRGPGLGLPLIHHVRRGSRRPDRRGPVRLGLDRSPGGHGRAAPGAPSARSPQPARRGLRPPRGGKGRPHERSLTYCTT